MTKEEIQTQVEARYAAQLNSINLHSSRSQRIFTRYAELSHSLKGFVIDMAYRDLIGGNGTNHVRKAQEVTFTDSGSDYDPIPLEKKAAEAYPDH